MRLERSLRTIRLSPEERAEVVRKVRELVDREGVLLALLYGSFVEGDSFRDVDVAVYLAPTANDLLTPLLIEEDIRASVGLPADVRVVNNAPPSVLKHILSRSIVLVERVPLLREKLLARAIDGLQRLRPAGK